jgi:hypothetical protein
MIIRRVITINGNTIYQNYSDQNVYIMNKTDGTLWETVNSIIDYAYEETAEEIKPIEEPKNPFER